MLLSGAVPRLINSSAVPRLSNSGDSDRYPAVGIVRGTGDCTGTLIDEHAVLGAAHCLHRGDGTFVEPDEIRVEFGGTNYGVDAFDVPDDYDASNFEAGDDLAVLHLSADVPDIAPMQIMRQPPQVGQLLTLVGFGDGGTSTNGLQKGFGVKRVGTTEIEQVTDEHIVWFFDSHLEGNTAEGDSGGPAFVELGGEVVIAGVTSGGDGNPATLGDRSFDTRLDVHAEWIDSVLGNEANIVEGDTPVITGLDPANPLRPRITFKGLANAESYEVVISRLSDNGQIVHARGIQTMAWTAKSDLGLGPHRIWVRAVIDGQTGPWSVPREFVVSAALELNGPRGRIVDNQPGVEWNVIDGVTEHQIWLENRTTGAVSVFRGIGSGTDRFQLPSPLELARYRVYIQATGEDGRQTPWSSPLQFTMAAAPDVRVPSNSSSGGPATIEWDAVAGATRYELWLEQSEPGENATVVRVTDVTSNRWTNDGRLGDGIWHVWVRALAEQTDGLDARSNWSDRTALTIENAVAPAPATAAAPALTDNGLLISGPAENGRFGVGVGARNERNPRVYPTSTSRRTSQPQPVYNRQTSTYAARHSVISRLVALPFPGVGAEENVSNLIGDVVDAGDRV